jgi:hypothetical protein
VDNLDLGLFSDQLRRNCGLKQEYVEINLQDLMAFDENLASLLMTRPNEYIPIVRMSGSDCIKKIVNLRIMILYNLFSGIV